MLSLMGIILLLSSIFPSMTNNEFVGTVLNYFPPSERATAYEVFYCESRFDNSMVGSSGELSIAQIMPGWASKFNYPVGWENDPNLVGSLAAYVQYEQGWTAWTVYGQVCE